MSKAFYDNNGGSNCNQVMSVIFIAQAHLLTSSVTQWIQIKNTKNGKVAYGKMRDSCPGCGYNDLGMSLLAPTGFSFMFRLRLIFSFCTIDMSPAVFEQLGTLDQGVLSISWHFEAKGWSP